MDMSHSGLSRPPIVVDFAPIFWEPFRGTGERVVALIAMKPNEASSSVAKTNVYVSLPYKRLTAMLGQSRGASAFGILQQAAALLANRLEAGLELHDATPPFEGFSVGLVRRSSGWSMKQVLHAAVNSVSAFGSSEEMIADEPDDSRHVVTTKNFINSLKTRVIAFDKSRKDRFHRRMSLNGSPDITIDYAYQALLVQITSLPASKQQEFLLHREAESKLAELSVAIRQFSPNRTIPKLFVNTEIFNKNTSSDELKMADESLKRARYFAEMFDTEVVTVESPAEAAEVLTSLEA